MRAAARRDERAEVGAADYRTYYERTAESLFVVEVTGDGRFVFAGLNPAHERLTGLTTEMIQGREPAEILAPAVAAAVTANYRRCVEAGQPIRYGEVLSLPAGERHWETSLTPIRDPSGRISRILGSARDVTDRQLALRALRTSEERYRAVVESQQELICRFRPDCTLTFVNEAYCRCFGRTRDELIGTRFLALMPEEEWEGARRHLASLSPSAPIKSYEHPVDAGGAVRWQRWTDRAFFDEAGRIVEYQSVGRDITERKQAEEALRSVNERMRVILAGISDCYFTLDQDWRLTEINPHAAAWLGLGARPVIGHTLWELCPDHWDQVLRERLRPALEERLPAQVEVASAIRPGQWLEVYAYPAGDGASVFFRDITERKTAEQAAVATMELLQSAMDALSAHIAILDEQGTVVAVNAAWRRFADANGYLGSEAGVGSNYFQICDASAVSCPDALAVGRGLRAVLAGAKDELRFDYPCACPGGERWFQVRATRFLADGRPRLVVAHEDMTKIRTAEESLRRLAARLLASQDDERRRIARELHDSTAQNLLAISLNLGLLERTPSHRSAHAQGCLADTRRLIEQVQQEIRTLAYLLHPPALDEAGLAVALRWYVEGFARRTGIAVELNVSRRLTRLPEEVERTLFRVVQESLTNVHRHAGAKSARVRLERKGARVLLEVGDDGRGVLPLRDGQDLDEIDNLGIGIPGMRARIRQLGGELKLRSSRRGTVVWAQVPIAQASTRLLRTA